MNEEQFTCTTLILFPPVFLGKLGVKVFVFFFLVLGHNGC